MTTITFERSLTLAGAFAVDALVGEPPTVLHPVVWLGQTTGLIVDRLPKGERAIEFVGGAFVAAAITALGAAIGGLAGRIPHPALRLPVTIWLLSSTFAGRGLLRAAEVVAVDLEAGDLDAARRNLRALVSRPTADLAAPLVAAAAIESAGENAGDSFVAPLAFYLIGGLPLALAYRAINTVDAMIGYRGRYEYTGKTGARLDDLVNLGPARLSTALIALSAGSFAATRRAWQIARRDAGQTASPNAGWPMAALAGALDVELEKVGHYRLGDPRRPLTPERLREAIAIVRRALLLSAGISLTVALIRDAA